MNDSLYLGKVPYVLGNTDANHKKQCYSVVLLHFQIFQICVSAIYFRTEDAWFQSNMHKHANKKRITPEITLMS